MLRLKTIFLGSLLILAMIGHVETASANYSVNVYILNAWYADLDGDGKKDDVGVDVKIELENNKVYTDIVLYIGIKLPSGFDFWFKVSFTMMKYTYYHSKGAIFSLYNTAIEQGWYKASAVGFADGESFSIMRSIIFDPPGSNAGNPSGTVKFY